MYLVQKLNDGYILPIDTSEVYEINGHKGYIQKDNDIWKEVYEKPNGSKMYGNTLHVIFTTNDLEQVIGYGRKHIKDKDNLDLYMYMIQTMINREYLMEDSRDE